MTASYLLRVTPCEHGLRERHVAGGFVPAPWESFCPGGSSVRVEPDYEVAARLLHYQQAVNEKWRHYDWNAITELAQMHYRDKARAIVDAALGLDQ
jgi:hypothetical protein